MGFAERFDDRSRQTRERLNAFREQFADHLPERASVLRDRVCIYAVGSAGRGEIGEHSDLDLFSVSRPDAISNVDHILIKTALLRATRACGFPEPSRDGMFLQVHDVARISGNFGKPEDDSENTFTARMLLLLESICIVDPATYDSILNDVLDLYWTNAANHQTDHLPIILVNDIVRYWRVVLLNYEAKIRKSSPPDAGTDTDAKRRMLSYKLRFSRCLTCFSAVAFLLKCATLDNGHVAIERARQMVGAKPVERLLWISGVSGDDAEVRGFVDELLELHESFLGNSQIPAVQLLARFSDENFCRERSTEASRFGTTMAEFILHLGRRNPLLRYIVV